MLKKLSLTLILITILVSLVYAEYCKSLPSKKISSYHLYLGMSVKQLEKLGFNTGLYKPGERRDEFPPDPVRTDTVFKINKEEKDDPSIIFYKEPAGKYEKILCWTYNGRVYRIDLYFKDKSREHYRVLRKILDEKYGFGERVPFTNIVIYSTYINGKKVEIYLDLAEVFAQYLKITYVYSCMDNLVKNEIERRKAQRVNNEL